jgi:hypothetical protein
LQRVSPLPHVVHALAAQWPPVPQLSPQPPQFVMSVAVLMQPEPQSV